MTASELDLMTVEEVGGATKRTASAVRQAIHRGEIHAVKLGRRWFVRRRDIHRLFDKALTENT